MDGVNQILDLEDALNIAGFGWHQIEMTLLCGGIMMNVAMGISLVSFVLPAAECDFNMSTANKGWLSAIPMLGSALGCFFWGIVADKKGRKFTMLVTLIIDGVVGIISAFSQFYIVFVLLRFVNAFVIVANVGTAYTFLGEFVPINYRERALCWIEVFGSMGIIIIAGIAWLIIPIQNMRLETVWFVFDSWNLFLILGSLASLLFAAWLTRFTETPKFLAEIGEGEKALVALRRVYNVNTKKSEDTYPVKGILECRQTPKNLYIPEKNGKNLVVINELKNALNETFYQMKELTKPELRKNVAIVFSLIVAVTTNYYTLLNWLPELFHRYEHFEANNPGEEATLCKVSENFNQDNGTKTTCGQPLSNEVFLNAIITGLICIPFNILVPLVVKKMGMKLLIFINMVLSSVVTFSLYLVRNSVQNLIISALHEACTTVGFGLSYIVAVNLFPTSLRMTAVATGSTLGRIGGLVGNLLFGYLLDLNCVVPIGIFAGLFVVCSIISLFLPGSEKPKVIDEPIERNIKSIESIEKSIQSIENEISITRL